ncbi:MAG: response regulator [Chloroflexi bacterium]|nr:response regulator [Chloroflexota bacterium]
MKRTKIKKDQSQSNRKKILVVDDAEHFRMKISRTLDDAGYKVFQARSGIEAVHAANANRPDMVIMDVAINGLDALREIKALDPDARIIMISRLGQEHSILDAFESGAEDFLLKALDVESMLSELSRTLT